MLMHRCKLTRSVGIIKKRNNMKKIVLPLIIVALISGCTNLSDKKLETASAETYFFDVQFSSDEADSVSVKIDTAGKGLKAFENELTSDFGEKIGTGTFLEVSQFSVGNDDEVTLKFVARKRIFLNWQILADGRKNPIFKAVKLDTELKVKCNSWKSLGVIPGKEPMRARVRKTN